MTCITITSIIEYSKLYENMKFHVGSIELDLNNIHYLSEPLTIAISCFEYLKQSDNFRGILRINPFYLDVNDATLKSLKTAKQIINCFVEINSFIRKTLETNKKIIESNDDKISELLGIISEGSKKNQCHVWILSLIKDMEIRKII